MICSKEKCTGCFACVNACPKHCIEMKEDIYGNIYPDIDRRKCVDCGICERSCPVNVMVKAKVPYKCYAGWSINDKERNTSSSGGIASVLSKYIIDNGGVVYGAVINHTNLRIEHCCVSANEDIYKLKKSKYVHSYIGDSYIQVLEDLVKGKIVMFTGTPCQIAGLKSFLKKEYDNLITLDIICHGVPSQKYLLEYIRSFGELDCFDYYSFRENKEYRFTLFNRGDIFCKIHYRESEYIMGFLNNLTQRENCFSCQYASKNRISDITLGDFWGIGEKKKFKHDTGSGVSAILVNTYKGQKLLEQNKEKLFLEERELQEAIEGNAQLRKPAVPNKNRKKFLDLYTKIGLKKSIRRILFKDFFKFKLKKIVKGE